MSIINDALKKAQLSFKKKDDSPEKKPEPQASQSALNVYERFYKNQQDLKNVAAASRDSKHNPSGKKTPKLQSTKKWIQISSAAIIFLLFAYGSFFFLSWYKPTRNFFHSIEKSSTSRTRSAQQAPKKRKYKPGELVLNGTSLIDGKRVALINDEIYEIGEMVNGKKITSINLNQIELLDNETIITLKVH